MECAICGELGGKVTLYHGCNIGSTHHECTLPALLGKVQNAKRVVTCPCCRKSVSPFEKNLILEAAKQPRCPAGANWNPAEHRQKTVPDPDYFQKLKNKDAAKPKQKRLSKKQKTGKKVAEKQQEGLAVKPKPRSHTGPFPCTHPGCHRNGEPFTRLQNLERHTLQWHQSGDKEPPRLHFQQPSMELYIAGCLPCKEGFFSNYSLKKHMGRPNVHRLYGAEEAAEWEVDEAATAPEADEESAGAPSAE